MILVYTCEIIQMAVKLLKSAGLLLMLLLLLLLTKHVALNLTGLSCDWPTNLSLTGPGSALSALTASFPFGGVHVMLALLSGQKSCLLMFTPPSLSGVKHVDFFIIEVSCFPQTPARNGSRLTRSPKTVGTGHEGILIWPLVSRVWQISLKQFHAPLRLS